MRLTLGLDRCRDLWAAACWDAEVAGSAFHSVLSRCNAVLQQAGLPHKLGSQPMCSLTQSTISRHLGPAQVSAWKVDAGADDLCRLHTFSADGAGTVLHLPPSHTLDTNLSKDDFHLCVGGRLGVDVCAGGGACRFCGHVVDAKGRHAQSCMAGGDAVALHNGLRDLLLDYCARAQLRPQAEAPGILDGHRRPADILIRRGAGLLPRLPDGTRPLLEPLALDVAVINALGESQRPA